MFNNINWQLQKHYDKSGLRSQSQEELGVFFFLSSQCWNRLKKKNRSQSHSEMRGSRILGNIVSFYGWKYFLQFYISSLWGFTKLIQQSRAEALVFDPLEPEPEPLEKNIRSKSSLEKKITSWSPLEKSQEPELLKFLSPDKNNDIGMNLVAHSSPALWSPDYIPCLTKINLSFLS